jgi:hypothetical protein
MFYMVSSVYMNFEMQIRLLELFKCVIYDQFGQNTLPIADVWCYL